MISKPLPYLCGLKQGWYSFKVYLKKRVWHQGKLMYCTFKWLYIVYIINLKSLFDFAKGNWTHLRKILKWMGQIYSYTDKNANYMNNHNFARALDAYSFFKLQGEQRLWDRSPSTGVMRYCQHAAYLYNHVLLLATKSNWLFLTYLATLFISQSWANIIRSIWCSYSR